MKKHRRKLKIVTLCGTKFSSQNCVIMQNTVSKNRKISQKISSQSSPALNKLWPRDKSSREAVVTSPAAKQVTFPALKLLLTSPALKPKGQVLP